MEESRCPVSRADSIREHTVMEARSTTRTIFFREHSVFFSSLTSYSSVSVFSFVCFPAVKNLKESTNKDCTGAAFQFGAFKLKQSHKQLSIIQQ